MRRFLAAIRFLTVLPVPGTIGSAEGDLAGSVPLFPIVGLLLGAVAAVAAWGLAHPPVPPMLVSAALVVLLLAFSGALHMDGLSDSADGMLELPAARANPGDHARQSRRRDGRGGHRLRPHDQVRGAGIR